MRDNLENLPLAFADCMIVDPPYGETSLGWDKLVTNWPSHVLPYLKPHGSMWVFGSFRSHLATRDEFNDWRFAQDIVWEKHNGSNSSNDRFRRVHEIAAHWYPATVPWESIYNVVPTTPNAGAKTVRRKERPTHWGEIAESTYESEDGGPLLMRSVIYHRSEHGRALHPTQKPVGLLEHLIENSCPPGGTVFDPFCGVASSGVAAIRGGRNYVGIELNPQYIRDGEERLSQAAGTLQMA
jgi:site-specific DNA-methyltransferase (adenine-specific)